MPFRKDVIHSAERVTLLPEVSEVRQLVDPAGKLPAVSLNIFEKIDIPGSFCREKFEIFHGRESAGWGDLITEYHDTLMHFDFVTLDSTDRYAEPHMEVLPRRERPKGLGLATYVIAIETAHRRGWPFESQSGFLSLGANHVWEILVQRAVAVVVESPQRISRGNTDKVLAKYRAELR